MDFDFRAASLHSARHLSAVQAARLHSGESSNFSGEVGRDDQTEGNITSVAPAALPVVIEIDVDDEGPGDMTNFDQNLCEDNYSSFYESDGEDDSRSYFLCPFCYMDIEISTFCGHLQDEHCYDLKNAVCPLCAANLGKDAIGHFIVQHSSSLKRRRRSEKSSFWTGSSAIHGKKLPTNPRGNKHESTTDPLLSPFICNVPLSNPNSIQLDETSSDSASNISDAKSIETCVDVLDGGDKQDHQERRQKAAFVQELIASTIF
ncbi:Protein DEHYDRATION-INDUCED 19 like [Quillaja saponaria]|uniref:Protein DEHYDRATION-INDUCED 19 like n=1 Tax=Quillaja saponaria TaxID=32244 RepID=A0AAD7LEB9_QUISA|nr:Protein DEHYDRATION-INDUCED 19 like [Quillaja saponaria]